MAVKYCGYLFKALCELMAQFFFFDILVGQDLGYKVNERKDLEGKRKFVLG